jgi:hypothetical protein
MGNAQRFRLKEVAVDVLIGFHDSKFLVE